MYEYSETAKQVFGVGELFLAPLFFLNYFLLNLFLFLQKKWGGGGGGRRGGAFPFTRSLVVVIVVIERDRLFGKLYQQRELLWKIVHLKDHGD